LSAGTGEVEGVGFFRSAEVVEFKDQVFGKVGFIAPDYPADT